ncbi:hypothetical protein GUITHDRAFT_103652 [Guillardia theta CCMP2712]|uniref:UDENN domain-containing protein n=1 Tax=Guillardia theta (strain CCMP2712) TaxID=905079 RepID=L1JQQ5_GUITC|nr:hypothetical protein GUITHDRAFT_103652 [Guillardia theta CCMP2712]EKX50418.1 hypothetical protein GUITHDRAFT_103652 [Guillardia theta CCMP2712]|eukprot:XP_005837398.1 hypothetical protein GUITHDRAFT_103652 [Guillardia theta CCMP2712]
MLASVAIAELDKNNDTLLTWSYPSLDEKIGSRLVKLCDMELHRDAKDLQKSLRDEKVGAMGSVIFARSQGHWMYLLPFSVSSFVVSVQSRAFFPNKFEALLKELVMVYASEGTPLRVLEGYLSAMTVGKFQNYAESAFPDTDMQTSNLQVPIRWMIEMFEVETVLLWSCMLLKKRMVVYSNKVLELQRFLRIIPALVPHRESWNVLKPYCVGDEEDEEELKTASFFVAGALQPMESNKDIASFLSKALEENVEDQAIISGLQEKNQELIDKLKMLAADEEDMLLSLSSLQEQLQNPKLAFFLYSVALSEGLARPEA